MWASSGTPDLKARAALSTPASCLHASNLVTYLSLASGVMAMAAAKHGSARGAAACLAVAVVADTFDGRFARRFVRHADLRLFGAQLDSLSDAVAFGVAPALCLLLLQSASASEWLVWAGTFVYAASAATRLGFYNVVSDRDDAGFVGVPAPVAALVIATAMVFPIGPTTAALLLIALAGAMLSPWRIARPTGARLALFVAWPVTLFVVSLIR